MDLEEAKLLLKKHWEEGVRCPCCSQFVKLYPYKMSFNIARPLIYMYHSNKEWVKINDSPYRGNGTYSLARFWGLAEPKTDEVPDGQKQTGYWRLTDKGVRFVKREITVPNTAYVYNDKCYRVDGESIDIKQALGKHFNYQELMGGIYDIPGPSSPVQASLI